MCYFFSWWIVWEEILRKFAFPLQLSHYIIYIQVFDLPVLLHFFINVVTSWNIYLAPKTVLSCVALILSLSRSALVGQGTWEELWVSWVQCQHWWFNCGGQILCAIQMILAWLESSQMQVKEFCEWIAVRNAPWAGTRVNSRKPLLAWILNLSTGSRWNVRWVTSGVRDRHIRQNEWLWIALLVCRVLLWFL